MARSAKSARRAGNPDRRVFGPPTMARIVKAMEFQARRPSAAAPVAQAVKERRG